MSKDFIIENIEQGIEILSSSDFTKKYCAHGNDSMQVSDGYHTMDELYDHRITLFIAVCRILYNDPQYQTGQRADIWRSALHSDGSKYDGWFILGIGRNDGEQITYYIPIERWKECEFAETREKAPEWDGHSSADVLERLGKL